MFVKRFVSYLCLLLCSLCVSLFCIAQPSNYNCSNGIIKFKSVATLETIEAESRDLRGLISTGNKSFALTVLIRTFQGFNSPLQREHFNENYLESHKFPAATFEGKFIEEVNFEKDGNFNARAKGILTIHGISQERLIKTNVSVKNGSIKITSKFTVLLSDHNITIPKIVNQKLSSEIEVNVETYFTRTKN